MRRANFRNVFLCQGFALEAHQLTISQLKTRLSDQAAYQTLSDSSSVAPGAAADKMKAALKGRVGGNAARGRPHSSGSDGRGAATRTGYSHVGGEEIAMVVEKMERVVANLQAENAELRKNLRSTESA